MMKRNTIVLVGGFLVVLIGALFFRSRYEKSTVHVAYRVSTTDWRTLTNGVAMCLVIPDPPSDYGDSKITVVRVDPARWELTLGTTPYMRQEQRKTAREWAESEGFTLAINAGMYHWHNVHDGYMEYRSHVISSETNHYQSVLAFDPRRPELAPFRLFDLDAPGITIDRIREDYQSLVQNLRLIKHPGENRWSNQLRRWSEAALGEDDQGRILLIFSRSPFSMYDFNRILLKAGIGLVAAQHLDGGPPAQIYVRVGETELELSGSYETGINENDQISDVWSIPNVLGIRKRVIDTTVVQ